MQVWSSRQIPHFDRCSVNVTVPSQWFMLVGAMIIIPIILIYTAWAYWVFRGKAGVHGYH
jgi:cytochrome bd-type quinol oxidase subunit 2